MIGLTGTICKHERGRVLRQLLPSVPLERLLLETDAPYMVGHQLVPKQHEVNC